MVFLCSFGGICDRQEVPYMDPKRVRFNRENHTTIILLMEKILHHSLKPCK